jgi:Ni/Fe-hydrogenase subunit HybB-like protein
MEDAHLRGADWQKKLVIMARPVIEKIFPVMLALAFVLPMMHQSSLGALMLFAGHKVHPLWQTQMLPFLYLVDAFVCGFAFVIFALMASCLYWRLPLDMDILGELGLWMSLTGIFWVALRSVDIVWRGLFLVAFKPNFYSVLFQVEQSFILIPALILLREKWRKTPTILLQTALFLIFGGLLYRFDPTTLAFQPGRQYSYFPSVAEIFIGVGYIAIAIMLYSLAVKRFPILPAPAQRWNESVAYVRAHQPQSEINTGALWQSE